jgi:hypothetical protein
MFPYIIRTDNQWQIIFFNIETTTRLFAEDCITYRKIVNNKDTDKLQIELNSLGECADQDEIIVSTAEIKTVCFTRARVTETLSYTLTDTTIQEASRL